MKIKLYSTGCSSCIMLKRTLEEKKVDFTIVDDMDNILEVANKHGFKTVPFLEIDNTIYNYSEAMEIVKKMNKGE